MQIYTTVERVYEYVNDSIKELNEAIEHEIKNLHNLSIEDFDHMRDAACNLKNYLKAKEVYEDIEHFIRLADQGAV